MIKVFIGDWFDLLESNDLGSSWLSNYSRPPPIDRHRLVSNVGLYHPNAPPVKDDDLELNTVFGMIELDSCDTNPGGDRNVNSDIDSNAT